MSLKTNNTNNVQVMPRGASSSNGLSTEASGDRLSFTLFIAIAIHGLIVFGVNFTTSKPTQSAPSVTVTLATRDDKKAPEKADFLAETNQQGSGSLNEAKEITTDVIPPPFDSQTVNEITPQESQKKAVPTADKVRAITSKNSDSRINHTEQANPEQTQAAGDSNKDTESINAQIASLRAKLALQRQTYANIPRERILTSVSTLASSEAAYLNQWTQKIEFIGNKNFPKEALQKKMTGKLRLEVTIKPDGTIAEVNLKQSSGQALFDQAAQQIVRQASPFLPFPPDIRKDYDHLVIIRTWHFNISGLSTSQ